MTVDPFYLPAVPPHRDILPTCLLRLTLAFTTARIKKSSSLEPARPGRPRSLRWYLRASHSSRLILNIQYSVARSLAWPTHISRLDDVLLQECLWTRNRVCSISDGAVAYDADDFSCDIFPIRWVLSQPPHGSMRTISLSRFLYLCSAWIL